MMYPHVHMTIKRLLLFAWILYYFAAPSTSTIIVAQQSPRIIVTSLAWSPDGSKIAVGYATYICQPDHPEFYDIQILDAQTGVLIRTLAGSYCDITSIDWSPNGAKLAASSLDGIGTWVWDVQSGQLQTRSQEGGQGTTEVKWRPPDGLQLAASAISNGIGILDPTTGETIGLARIGGTALDWSPDGSKLVSGSGYETLVYVADMVAGQQIMALEGHVAGLTTVAWSPDGTKLASGGGLDDPTIRIWDATTGQNLLVLQGHTIAVSEVVWSPDSSQLASTGDDGTVRVWDTSTGEQIAIFQYPGRVYAVDWSPDGTQLVYGGFRSDGQDAQLQIVPAPPTTACDLTIPASDTAALISAIASANGAGTPQTLCLMDSTYTLDTAPTITGDITIVGDGATIIFADGGGFEVAEGSTLTLLHVTVTSAA